MMKKYLFCTAVLLIVLSTSIMQKNAGAQPVQDWATYYGQFTDYYPYYYPEMPIGTHITDLEFDKNTAYLYVLGLTSDTSNIATQGSFKENFTPRLTPGSQLNAARSQVFLAKLDTLGHLIWATYFGGNHGNMEPKMALDNAGNIYITGSTNSDSGIATPGSHQPVFTGEIRPNTPWASMLQPFLVKFDNSGHLVWGTYYGISNRDSIYSSYATDIAFDPVSNTIYIVGLTGDTAGLATTGSFKPHITQPNDTLIVSGYDAFMAKFDTAGNRIWGTYYGGGKLDGFKSVWIGQTGDVYIGGYTNSSTGIATTGAFLDTLTHPFVTSFLVKFDSTGQRLWGTYIGDVVFGSIAGGKAEQNDAIYLSGFTSETDSMIATNNAYQDTVGGSWDMVLFKFSAIGHRIWSTYFGGDGSEILHSPAKNCQFLSVDEDNNIFMISPTTSSTQGINHACSPYPAQNRTSIISKWYPSGALAWSSFYDGELYAVCNGFRQKFYVGGRAIEDSLSTIGALQPTKVPDRPSGYLAALVGSPNCPAGNVTIANSNHLLTVDSAFEYYQWYQNNQQIPGANSYHYLRNDDTGIFYVVVFDSCGCRYNSDTLTLPTNGIHTTSIKGLHLNLYPNPNVGGFKLSGSADRKISSLQWVISDLSGRQLKSGTFKVNGKEFIREFKVGELASGMYFLQIKTAYGLNTIKLNIRY